ncbi:MAG: hypothetical protein ACE5PT_10950 [Gemmatimonadales bacterium]
MTTLMLVMRLIHIGLGVFWAGTIFFFVIFLEPSVREAGPDGAKVMQGLFKRHYLNVMPVVAALTILSGFVLYWRLSGGMNATWIGSDYGLSLTVGGAAAIVAFVIGLFGMRRAALRAAALGAELQQAAEGARREKLMAEAQAQRNRARKSAHWVAGFLAVAVISMAVARYV